MDSNEQVQQARQIACKVKIINITTGKYVKEEGWNPNYVLTDEGVRVSRVNLMAAVVGIPINEGESFQSIVIDDGSARISVRDFEKSSLLKDVNVGDVVLLIGKPREYSGEKYIIPEIVRKIENKKWIGVRKIELQLSDGASEHIDEPQKNVETPGTEADKNVVVEDVEVVEDQGKKTVFEKIGEWIKKSDGGEGIDIGDILKNVDGASEDDVAKLLREGELFEVKPGKLKLL